MEITLGKIIIGLILAASAWFLAYEFTGLGGPTKEAYKSYIACFCVVLAASNFVAEMIGAPVFPGDEMEATRQIATEYIPGKSWREVREYANNIFYVSIIPALVGVYCGRRSPTHGEEQL